jgi:hypothetical protein
VSKFSIRSKSIAQSKEGYAAPKNYDFVADDHSESVFGVRRQTLPMPEQDMTDNKYFKNISNIEKQIQMAESINKAKSKLLLRDYPTDKKVKHIVVKPDNVQTSQEFARKDTSSKSNDNNDSMSKGSTRDDDLASAFTED